MSRSRCMRSANEMSSPSLHCLGFCTSSSMLPLLLGLGPALLGRGLLPAPAVKVAVFNCREQAQAKEDGLCFKIQSAQHLPGTALAEAGDGAGLGSSFPKSGTELDRMTCSLAPSLCLSDGSSPPGLEAGPGAASGIRAKGLGAPSNSDKAQRYLKAVLDDC